MGAYAALFCAPLFSKTLWSLRHAVFWFDLMLYVIGPICWQMPVAWRKAYLFIWLSFTFVARVFASQIPIDTRDKPIDDDLFFLGLLVDGLFLTVSILAIRTKEGMLSWKISGYFILLAILPAIGVYVALMVWSSHIASAAYTDAKKIAQGRPFCIASYKRRVETLSQLSGVSLLRARHDIGPGAGFSFLHYSRFYAVLAVQIGDKEQYWNWSFRRGSFVRDVNTPEIRLRVDACNPITGDKYYYSEF